LHLENLPSGAEKVRYEIHHDEFDPGVWYKWKPENGFQTSMQSYGNVLISAQVATRKQTHVLSTTLYAALLRTHVDDDTPSVRSALSQIRRY
jgi:hypothetical protein